MSSKVEATPSPDDGALAVARAEQMLTESGTRIVAGVQRCVPGWVEAQVDRLLDAWGRAHPADATKARSDAIPAGQAAAARIVASLEELLAEEPVRQRATPLEIVRAVYVEPTAILRAAGVPPVVRDPFDERVAPDDIYDLTPRTLGDLGDPDLAPLHLAWGMAKATVLRGGRAEPDPGP